jgi:hypothetical protein
MTLYCTAVMAFHPDGHALCPLNTNIITPEFKSGFQLCRTGSCKHCVCGRWRIVQNHLLANDVRLPLQGIELAAKCIFRVSFELAYLFNVLNLNHQWDFHTISIQKTIQSNECDTDVTLVGHDIESRTITNEPLKEFYFVAKYEHAAKLCIMSYF